jgi:tripartite-type tricarboxylate transporter receptor subunit TctC
MFTSHLAVRVFCIGIMALGANMICAQAYPNRPVRIVTSEPGGGSDFVARLVAQGLSASLGQQVIVDNRVGAIAPEVLLTEV